MKKTLRIAALIMVLVLTCVCFASCSKNESEEKNTKAETTEPAKTKSDETEEVKKVVEDYFDAKKKELDELDDIWKNIEEFVAKDSEAYEEHKDFSEEKEEMVDLYAEGFCCDDSQAEDILITMYNYFAKETKYEIDKVEVNDNKATVTYEIKMPDTSDDGQQFEDYLAEEYNKAIENYIFEDWEEGTWELFQTDTGVQEQVKSEFAIDYPDELNEILLNAMKKLDTIKENNTFTLEKIDDKWLIVNYD